MGSFSSHSNDPDLESQWESQPQSQFQDKVTMAAYLAFTEQMAKKMRSPSCSLDGFEKALDERGVSEESKLACVPQDSHSYSRSYSYCVHVVLALVLVIVLGIVFVLALTRTLTHTRGGT
jgi:hypothetical protein